MEQKASNDSDVVVVVVTIISDVFASELETLEIPA